MKYQPPYGITDPNGPYINGDPSIGRAGSIPPAAAIELPQREIVAMITKGGLSPSDGDLVQLAKAIQGGKIIYGPLTGTATAYLITLDPAPSAYGDGLAIWVLPSTGNTGAATINVNGLGAKNIVRRGGGPLQAGDMPANAKSLLTYNSTNGNFELYGTGFAATTGFMPVLTANTSLYVNGVTGDDVLYDGTSATVAAPHGPFKTIARAMSETFKYGPSVYLMTINLAAGTYNEVAWTGQTPGPTVLLKGANPASPQSTMITGAVNSHTVAALGGNTMYVEDLGATHTQSGSFNNPGCFAGYINSALWCDNTYSGSSTEGWVFVANSGNCYVGNHVFGSGSSIKGYFASSAGGNLITARARQTPPSIKSTLTFGGPVTVTVCGVYASASGLVTTAEAPYQAAYAAGGNCTGVRFISELNGVILSVGNGINYYPGTSPGTTGTGGQYL
jgi:hypothetical protein